jgi:hypothetical protein
MTSQIVHLRKDNKQHISNLHQPFEPSASIKDGEIFIRAELRTPINIH